MAPLRHPGLRRALLWLVVAAAYLGVARLSHSWGFFDKGVPLLLLVQGVAFSAVQLGGPWQATALLAGGFAEGLCDGMSPAAALLLGLAAAGAGLASFAVVRAGRLEPHGERVADTVIRITASGAAAVVAAAFQLAMLEVEGRLHEPLALWGTLILSNFAGILVVAPFVRGWLQRQSRGSARLPEWIVLLLGGGALAAAVASGTLGTTGPIAYVVFPVIVWAALRAGRMGVSTLLLIVALLAAEYTARGQGPFVGPGIESAVALDTFLIVLSVTGLMLSGLEQVRRVTARGLTEAEERHRRLVEQLPLVTYMRSLDRETPPLLISPQAVDMLGYPLETWLSQPYLAETIIHPDDRELHAELNARSLAEDVVEGEFRVIAADGRTVWIFDHMVTVRDERGTPVAQQGFVVDITERKQLEEQLTRAQRIEALGLLAGGVAHDFNNLLTAISGYTQLALLYAGKSDDLVRRHLGEVQAAAASATDLTRRLLAFGRRQVLERTVLDLNEVVIDVQQLLKRVIGENVAVVMELEPSLPYVQADRAQLGQVLMNLAVNARDAMPQGGTLTIRTSSEGDDVVLAVSDTGSGMDEETRKRIFEPFFTTKEVGEGTGLGLAMVHGIVEQSGGRIGVESAPGRGATFRVVLPSTQEALAATAASPHAARGGGSETVLVVEDEDVVRRLTTEMLERHGYRVIATPGPDDALNVGETWDLLLTDVVMPTMSGPELARRLGAGRNGTAVLFTSGYSGSSITDLGDLTGELLEKPFTLEELGRKVRDALDARRS